MYWSRYSTAFRSPKHGAFVYNAPSNSLIQVDDAHYELLTQVAERGEFVSKNIFDNEFLNLLRQKKVVVTNPEDAQDFAKRHFQRTTLCFDSSHLDLSICPTLGCNFACPYCFEDSQRQMTFMRPETIEKLLEFVASFDSAKTLSVTWYGGEPTINKAFEIVRFISERLQFLDIDFKSAALVTNGYMLTEDKARKLNDLNISNVQISIDGPREIHDQRRALTGGRPTFDRILANIDALMESGYAGDCNIRVNIDQQNISSFLPIRNYLLERFAGSHVSVYAGYVDMSADPEEKGKCSVCAADWADFTVEQFRDLNSASNEGVYPLGGLLNICAATASSGFVVGPQGELYKCWEDVGRPAMVIGSVHNSPAISNDDLVAKYSIAGDPFLDEQCRECSVFPICSGGCANRRLRKKFFGEAGLDYCSLYKGHLTKYLLEYFEAFETRAICARVLGHDDDCWEDRGYRVVRP